MKRLIKYIVGIALCTTCIIWPADLWVSFWFLLKLLAYWIAASSAAGVITGFALGMLAPATTELGLVCILRDHWGLCLDRDFPAWILQEYCPNSRPVKWKAVLKDGRFITVKE